ncbi:hypothetical protein BC332_23985 [Capsicum chinense]|nr:hypothetical protein BC332_23985 [Capsicum chinense]
MVDTVDEGETSVVAPNIFLVNQPILNEVDVGIGTDAESEEEDNNEPLPSDNDSEELELFRKEKSREVNDQLEMFLELEKGLGAQFQGLLNAISDVFSKAHHRWAYFDTIYKNSACENNFTESFTKWILNSRGKSIIKMLEEIRTKVMVRLEELENEGRNWKKNFSPYAMELYNDYYMIAHCCEVKSNGDQWYEVVEGEDTHVVHIGRKKCTCRTWDLTDIPCPHSIKAYIHNKQEPEDHVNWWYSKEAYMLVYMHKIQPVRVSDTDGDESEEDEHPTIQPKRISEAKTRLEAKKVPRRPTGTRKIGFKEDKNVSAVWAAYTVTKDAHTACIFTKWDEFKNLDYKKYMITCRNLLSYLMAEILLMQRTLEIGFIVYAIGKPLDTWLREIPTVV